MVDKKVWLITGAGRGLGLDIAQAALAAGHAVVATGRDPAKVTAAIGHHDNLLVIKLDITRLEDAYAAVAAAVDEVWPDRRPGQQRWQLLCRLLRRTRVLLSFAIRSKRCCLAR